MDPVTTTAPAARTLSQPLRPEAWRTYAYFLLATALAVVGVAFLFAAGLASGLLLVTLIGIPLLALIVMSGRAWNRLYRSLARLTGVEIEAPPPFVRPPGRLQTVAAALTDGVGWRSLGFVALHSLVMTPVGYGLILAVVVCASAVASPVAFLVTGEPFITIGEPIDSLPLYLLLSVAGVAGLYATGWLILAASRFDVWMARALLGATDRDRRVGHLERARADVVDESAATLQRVERDLHDGTQARLITVAMALARAEDHFAASDVGRARTLVSDALANTKDTLAELREIVRGIRPPALDLGLEAAVGTLAARNPLPVEVSVDLPVRPSLGVETMAYFCVAELLANVSRHSGADHAAVSIRSDPAELRITVRDNGSGGVQVGNGSGLTGLRDRLAMLDGELTVVSPDGGPTVVTVTVPPGAGR
ncbi:sensor domain-containing protein [Mycolicibacterium flavescens]|uniref:histidine kinase n=1 Tax=Mycolicibacterium flavescens TaxID=1776 RepID=A0A1E3RP48_MYCFV|nr:sensor histidine kinase [Mycolicibacterium flavescens]MCV7281584.1 sensor domain-containing protein [Mycolicibacterium flavescens]ODQ91621.1 histidine kinase [Mycolicibacterium flavescens]